MSSVATGDTVASLNGLTKVKYAKTIEDAVPNITKLLKRIPFTKATTIGNYYSQPVTLQNEVGFTYTAGGQANLPIMNPAVPMAMREAQVQSVQLVLRSAINLEILNKAKNAGEEAFEAASLLVIKNMIDSMANRLEQQMLHGGSGNGTSTAGTVNTNSGATASTFTFTITTAQWAAGIWTGQEGAALDIYTTSTLSAGATPVNTTVVPTAGYPTLVSVNPAARQITVKVTNGSDYATFSTAVTAGGFGYTFFWGGSFGNEMVGLVQILSNTGVLFNIDAGAFDLWRANVQTVSGPLSLSLIQQAAATLAGRGAPEQDYTLIVHPGGWADLATSQAALRMYDRSYSPKEFENGAGKLRFHSQIGSIAVESHYQVKEGEAFMLPFSEFVRIGACDPTFQQPGAEQREPFYMLIDQQGVQAVRYANQQLFCRAPMRALLFQGIVNSVP